MQGSRFNDPQFSIAWAKRDERFIPGFSWPVPSAHREFIELGYFDNGAVFHSETSQYRRWTRQGFSIQIIDSKGEPSKRFVAYNLSAPCICEFTSFGGTTKTDRYLTTNGEVLMLLRTGIRTLTGLIDDGLEPEAAQL